MANTKAPKARLAILITPQDQASFGDRFFHIFGAIQQYRDGRWIGVDDNYDPVNGFARLTGLRIVSQGDQSSRAQAAERTDGGLYGWDVEYRDLYSLDLRDAKKHYDTLHKLHGALTKLNERRGTARSFGEYVGRVAEIIGADTIRCAGRDKEPRDLTLGSGIAQIDHIAREWAKPTAEMA